MSKKKFELINLNDTSLKKIKVTNNELVHTTIASKCSKNKTFFEITSADSKILGFDYQYLCFIDKLLTLNDGETIEYETKDDISIITQNNNQILIQVKHSLKTTSNGSNINLTDFDVDLWKTLYNWANIVMDKNDGRSNPKLQEDFIKKTSFVLLTNKGITQNSIIKNITLYKNKQINKEDFSNWWKELSSNNKDIINYISTLKSMKNKIFKLFIEKITTKQEKSDLVEKIKTTIRNRYMIADIRVDDVFNGLFAELKIDFFDKVKQTRKQIISKEEFIKKYGQIFENNRTTLLVCRDFKPTIPAKLQDQHFMKELIEIKDVDSDDIVTMADYTNSMLNMNLNLEKWHNDGEITFDEMIKFHKEARLFWKNKHTLYHIETNSLNDNVNARKCLCDIRTKNLNIKQVNLDLEISNGEFYYLANEKQIGWKKYWQKHNL